MRLVLRAFASQIHCFYLNCVFTGEAGNVYEDYGVAKRGVDKLPLSDSLVAQFQRVNKKDA